MEQPPELKEKLEATKKKLEQFKKEILKSFDKYIVAVSVLPPKEKKNKLSVLIIVDDSETKDQSKYELIKKIEQFSISKAKEIDPTVKPDIMLLSELREACYDAKYDIIKAISNSAPIHDPKDLISALKISQVHKEMVIKKFEKYILSYVAAGSLFRGEKSHDIDVYIIVDDTDVKKMARVELKDKLRAIITSMGFEAQKITGVNKSFHVQTYILTDFWENMKDANPVIFTLLRDGVPLYDRGVFMPWKILLKMGRVKPSQEAIDMHMDIGSRLISRLKAKLLSIVGEDLYYATLNPAQATLMLYGIPPPTPKETIKLMDQIFVKKEHILEKKYIDTLERVRKAYKEIEHGKLKSISGKEIDDLLKDVEAYLKRLDKLFEDVQKKVEGKQIVEIHDTCMNVAKDLLETEKISVKDPIKGFQQLVKDGKIPERFFEILKLISKAKKDYQLKKLSRQEADKVRKDTSILIRTMVEYIQRKKGLELERSKIRVKYSDKIAEVYIFDGKAFIIPDIKNKEIQKAQLNKDGSLYNITSAKIIELEKEIATFKPKKIAITPNLINSLSKILGKDMEILLSY